jgi:RNA polymerase sigma-70 factor (ECF subfamily)
VETLSVAAQAHAHPEACAQEIGDFEELVIHYWSRVYGLALRLMGDRQEAEDQTQEVFLKIYRCLDTLQHPAALTSWIMRITANTCYDALERSRRCPPVVPLTPNHGDTICTFTHARQPRPEEAALRAEERGYMALTLAQLDSNAREALILRDVEGRSYEEIASMLSLGMSAVKMRIRRGRLAFQETLGRICPELAPVGHA